MFSKCGFAAIIWHRAAERTIHQLGIARRQPARNKFKKSAPETHLVEASAANCQWKETTSTMKKLIIVTPLLAVALFLTSCTTVVEKPVTPTTTTTSTTVKKSTVPSTTETTVRSSGNY
jgi:hypothetical protein